jgi:choline dehydrogenase
MPVFAATSCDTAAVNLVGSTNRLSAEVVVVGGGSAGAVVAGRLAERGVDVVLVEAGPDYGSFSSGQWPNDLVDARALAASHDWGYHDDRWTWSRARVMGGCSSHNGAIAAVGHSADYDEWTLPGWTAHDVLPLFNTVIDKMRVRAYERHEAVPFHEECLQAAESLGWTIASDLCDLNANESFGLETVNVVGTTRWNAAFAYLDPVRERPNLRIVDCTITDRFTTAADGVLIHGWRVPAMPANQHQAFASTATLEPVEIVAGQLVISAGVYGTPAILQRSGIGNADRLIQLGITPVHNLDGVGANLHDHPMINVERAVGPRLQRHLDDVAATGFLPEEQTLGKFRSSLAVDGLYDTHVFPVCASDQTRELHGRVAVEVACMKPRSRGECFITSSDPLAAPHIDHRYLSDLEGHDLTVLRDGVEYAGQLLSQPVLGALLGDVVHASDTDEAIRNRVAHYYHPVGTCAMGTGAQSVCDPRGRVYGVDHVVVADASLMPVIPRANTNLPTVMIGERIASWL